MRAIIKAHAQLCGGTKRTTLGASPSVVKVVTCLKQKRCARKETANGRARSHTLRLLLLAAVGLGSAAAALGGADGAWSRSCRLHGRAATRLGCTAARFGAHCAWSSRRHGRAAISGLGCAALGLVRANGAWGGRGGAAASEESDEGESGEGSDGLHGEFLNVLSASADGVVFADTAKILSSLFESPHSGSACSKTEIKFLGGDGIGQQARVLDRGRVYLRELCKFEDKWEESHRSSTNFVPTLSLHDSR